MARFDVRIALQCQQGSDRLDVEPEFARMANELQPTDGVVPIRTTIGRSAPRRRQQADAFVVANGRHFEAGLTGNDPDRCIFGHAV